MVYATAPSTTVSLTPVMVTVRGVCQVAAVKVSDFLIGVTKSSVFGVVVALAGCLRGMQSGRSAAAVGLAATSAVVTSIVCLIVLDGVFAVILNVLGF